MVCNLNTKSREDSQKPVLKSQGKGGIHEHGKKLWGVPFLKNFSGEEGCLKNFQKFCH